ncbi:MAG: DUF1272 domain-containing protein [Pseudomonadales bacterium]
MLALRPTCEHCERPLPPASTDAMICSFECTFCRDCVETLLQGACPNCGGGFVPRPIRPAREWVKGVSLGTFPGSTDPVHRPVDRERHRALLERVGATPAAQR